MGKYENVNVRLTLGITFFLLVFLSVVIHLIAGTTWTAFYSLFQWNAVEVLYAVLVALVIVGLNLCAERFLPESALDDGGINAVFFGKMPMVEASVVCLLVSVTEELLFRGTIQWYGGFWLATVLFIVAHGRYLKKWALFSLLSCASIALGLLFQYTESLTITIIAHFLLDWILVIYMKLTAAKEEFT
ncbi:MAG: lysostaphin resistance A-like protein [Bacilli bacterium]